MELHYPASRCKCDVTWEMNEKEISLTEATLDRRPSPLAYAAIGYVKDRVFYPWRTVVKPKLPLQLPLQKKDVLPVVQLVNAYGDQVFFSVKK